MMSLRVNKELTKELSFFVSNPLLNPKPALKK